MPCAHIAGRACRLRISTVRAVKQGAVPAYFHKNNSFPLKRLCWCSCFFAAGDNPQMPSLNLEFSRHVFRPAMAVPLLCSLPDHIGSSFQQAQGVRLKFSETAPQ